MILSHSITIDLIRPTKQVIHVVQEDSTRRIALRLTQNGSPYSIVDGLGQGETLLTYVEAYKQDGTYVMYDHTSAGDLAVVQGETLDVWTVLLDGQCFTAPGWTQINVLFMTEAGKNVHTFAIMADVQERPGANLTSEDFYNLQSLNDIRASVEDANASIQLMARTYGDAIESLRTDVDGSVKFNAQQSLTSTQKYTARTNIDAIDPGQADELIDAALAELLPLAPDEENNLAQSGSSVIEMNPDEITITGGNSQTGSGQGSLYLGGLGTVLSYTPHDGTEKTLELNTNGLDVNGLIIHDVGTPTQNSDAANKAYVDNKVDTLVTTINSWLESLVGGGS